jgi:hypothetical protein
MTRSNLSKSNFAGRALWRDFGAISWSTSVTNGIERSRHDKKWCIFTWTFETFWLATSADEFRSGPVRDAEVPGSNPGSPTKEVRGQNPFEVSRAG